MLFAAYQYLIESRAPDLRNRMFRINSAHFSGKSGQPYDFYFYPIDQSLQTAGAVYLITRGYKNSGGGVSHDVLYVGDTPNLSVTLVNHPKRDCFIRQNANYIGTHIDEDHTSRAAKRDDLIQRLNPACNR